MPRNIARCSHCRSRISVRSAPARSPAVTRLPQREADPRPCSHEIAQHRPSVRSNINAHNARADPLKVGAAVPSDQQIPPRGSAKPTSSPSCCQANSGVTVVAVPEVSQGSRVQRNSAAELPAQPRSNVRRIPPFPVASAAPNRDPSGDGGAPNHSTSAIQAGHDQNTAPLSRRCSVNSNARPSSHTARAAGSSEVKPVSVTAAAMPPSKP